MYINIENLTLREMVSLNNMIKAVGRDNVLRGQIQWHGDVMQLAEEDILPLENMYKALRGQYKNVEQLYLPFENESIANLIGRENMNKILRSKTKTYEELLGSLESLSEDELSFAERERDARIKGYNSKQSVQHHGSRESLSEAELSFAEREKEARIKGYNSKEAVQHHGSYESLSTDEADQLAASNDAVIIGQNSKAGRYDSAVGGTVEDMSISEADQLAASLRGVIADQNSKAGRYESGIGGTTEDAIAGGDSLNDKMAARWGQIKTSKDHVKTLQGLIENPHNFDADSFSKSVLNGLKDNQTLKNFMNSLRELISEQTELIANTPKTPEDIARRNHGLGLKLSLTDAEASQLSTDEIRKKAKSNLEAYLNIYAHMRHYIVEYNGVIDASYINISNNMISRIFDAQKVLGREKASQLIMMPTPLKKHSKYDIGDFISPAVTALYSMDPGMRKVGAGLDIHNDIYKNPKSPRWQKEDGVEAGV